jgi:hypothetical protein
MAKTLATGKSHDWVLPKRLHYGQNTRNGEKPRLGFAKTLALLQKIVILDFIHNSTGMNEESYMVDVDNMQNYESNVDDGTDDSHLEPDNEYEEEEEVWEGPNGEDVCYDTTCHDYLQELREIVDIWRAHNEGSDSADRFANDMITVRRATSAFLSIRCMPEVTYEEWEACDHYFEQGTVPKLLMIRTDADSTHWLQ